VADASFHEFPPQDCCKEAIVGNRGLPAIIKVLKVHIAAYNVQEYGLGALRDIIVRHSDYQVSVCKATCTKQSVATCLISLRWCACSGR
jgi:hypothetical protein